jgi:hypothetical protein
MNPVTIKIFLVNGSPNGLRTAELSNWSGKAIAAPRTELNELLKRPELNAPGVYFLTGIDPDTGERAIYIGEAEKVSSRLKNHVGKEFWTSVAVIVSKDDNLTKAHIRFLEGALIGIASDNNSAQVMNTVASGASLPESDEAEMATFLNHALQLLSVLGIKEFDKTLESPTAKKDILTFKTKGIVATGKRTSNGFLIFKGSQAVLESRPSAQWSRRKRDELQERGILEINGDHMVFTIDSEFGSPSTAGCMVAGGSTNGLTAWKNARGQTLKKIES